MKKEYTIDMQVGVWGKSITGFWLQDDQEHADVQGIYGGLFTPKIKKGDKILYRGHKWNVDNVKYTGNPEDHFEGTIFCESKL